MSGLDRLFSSLKRKKTQRYVGLGLLLLVLLAIGSYIALPSIATHYLERKLEKIEQSKKIRITIDQLSFNGLTQLKIGAIRIMPAANDTLLEIKNSEIRVDPWQLFLLNIDVESARFESITVKTIKDGNYCNYRFLFTSDKRESDTAPQEANFSKMSASLFNSIFRLIPAHLSIDRLWISSDYYGQLTTVAGNALHIEEHHMDTHISIRDSISAQRWHIVGNIDKSNRSISGLLTPAGKPTAEVPYIFQHWGAKASFAILSFDMKVEKSSNSNVLLNGKAAFSNLMVNHARLSPEDIRLGNGAFDYRVLIERNSIEIDSTSTITVNKLNFRPYFKAEKNNLWHLTARIDKSRFAAADLFESLPKGLFNTLEQIKVQGELSYHFLLDVDLNCPDSLKLESSLRRHSFAFRSMGELGKINGPFLYTAYENERPVRTFEVGPTNPSYRPLESISPLLRQAVLQSEDGQFYFHRGFRLDALREALIHDLKVKRFARGGSTISMQLVKNVYLNRRKNIARKLEEALLVWLLEENHISSKNRMFEVYLNIAEWGPRIYGIGEAARFYFDKEPSDLTLNESIFLASIIPSPKRFAWAFDNEGKLKENRNWQFNRVAERLFRTGYITADERAAFVPEVTLTGVARQSLKVASDSTTVVNDPVEP